MTKSYRSGRQLGAGLKLANKQRGVSFMAVFAIMSVVFFLALAAFKVGPHYMEYMTVKNIATDLSHNDELMKGTKSKVVKHINQAYNTNNLWDLKAKDTIDLQKDSNKGFVVTVNYEKRINLIYNIDVVTVFNKSVNSE
ncbi:MAG: DUF4845 domain-containing protein [Granulosicoccaceae bacterium]